MFLPQQYFSLEVPPILVCVVRCSAIFFLPLVWLLWSSYRLYCTCQQWLCLLEHITCDTEQPSMIIYYYTGKHRSRFKTNCFLFSRHLCFIISWCNFISVFFLQSSRLENRLKAVGVQPRWPHDTPLSKKLALNFADKWRWLSRYS
jgi:hypothetical protein